LKAYQAGFFNSMRKRADSRSFNAWIIGDDGDPARARAFLDILDLHRVEYQPLGVATRSGDREFQPGHAWIIPVQQKQFGLLEAMMERRTNFQDNTFYDVSAWTLPLAFNLPFTTVSRVPQHGDVTGSSKGLPPETDAAAWAIPWNQLEAPALLQSLLRAGVRVRVADQAFSAQTGNGLQSFAPGTLVIQAGLQAPEARQDGLALLTSQALAGLDIYSLSSTMTSVGPDLGSKHFVLVAPIKPLLVGGKGVSTYEVGEQWFLLDQRLGIPTPVVEQQRLGTINIWDYTHLLFADGEYESLGDEAKQVIARWVRDGGVLVVIGRAANWAESICFEALPENCPAPAQQEPAGQPVTPRAYADFAADQADQVIGGAIVASVLDLSHPIAFGYTGMNLPLFRRGTAVLKPSDNPYSTPVRYTREPLMAGFIGKDRLAAFAGQPAVIAEKQGQGVVVRFANTPLFRGFWRGTEKLYVNALYFAQVIETTDLPGFTPVRPPEAKRQP
jgi:hypothetical protein